MIEELKTLVALNDLKTMTKAATYLRVSQSTVSKRIQNLENYCGQKVVIPNGRRIVLTDFATSLAQKAPHLLLEFEQLFVPAPHLSTAMAKLVIGIGASILTSWAAKGVAKFEKKNKETKIEVHAHRAQVIFDKVNAGEYHLGLCALKENSYENLVFEEILEEPFVLIPSGLKPYKLTNSRQKGNWRNSSGFLEVVTIEESAHSWQQIRRLTRDLKILPVRRLETFFAAAQLAINGFGHGLVPEGTARALGVLNKCQSKILGRKLYRKIGLLGSKTMLNRPEVEALKKLLRRP